MTYPVQQGKNEIQAKGQKVLKDFFSAPAVKSKFNELLGKNASSFITSVLQIASENKALANVNPVSIYSAACMAATLNLPINNALGFAYIVPYKGEAQFQLGYKGFIQLAQRSGQFERLVSLPVYERQLIEEDPINGFKFDWKQKPSASEKPIGYYAFFRLINGFTAELYMTAEELEQHGKRYSQSYKKGYGVWADNFDAMALKTVTKLLLSKQAPLSVDMQKAVLSDQSVIKDIDGEFSYIDNEPETDSKKSDEQALVAAFQNQQAKTAEATKPTPTEEQFAALVEAVSTGEKEVAEVLETYNLTEEQMAKINAL
nr:MAG TPA: RecT protein [Caudoviricetes sp.]